MPGRRPKPTAVRKLQGNPGKRTLRTNEPIPNASSGRAPRNLGPDGARFWRKYAPALAALGVLTQVDEPALRLAAEHYDVAVRAAMQLHDEELVLDGRDGPKKNPLTQVLRDHSQAALRYMIEFGMTPASRSRLGKPAEEQPSLADELFAIAAERAAQLSEQNAAAPEDDLLAELRHGD